ncbi:MAG TPA: aldolase [Pseudonocardiaceae bacterium]|nr:aldolase [Pseudonocardiaceae bacterium]
MLDPAAVARLTARLSEVDERRAVSHPGERAGRQPVHTCYLSAGQVAADLPARWGAAATDALRRHAATPAALAEVAGLAADLAEPVYERVLAKLAAEPVEDLRVDFEDGYGEPADDTEDADAVAAATVVAGWHRDGTAPAWHGLRVKSFDTPALRDRSIRTLDVFLTTLFDATGNTLPAGFVLTFPKVTAVEQVEVFAELLALLEARHALPAGALRFEIQVETTESIVDSTGRLALPGFIAAGDGRVSGLHFGTYDYTAACGLPISSQHLAHGACDFARHVMQVSAAGTGVWCSDGSTNVLPVGDAEAVRHGWRTHAGLVARSLAHGFYQGWDLHPHQLVTRYAAVFGFYRGGGPTAAARLAAYAGGGAAGSIADEPASARVLAGFLLRALDCGAWDRAELTAATGLSVERLHSLARRPAGQEVGR